MLINTPSSVYVRFTEGTPKLFQVFDGYGHVHYFRYISDPSVSRIKFRMPVRGNYTFNVPLEIVKTVPIEIPDYVKNPVLPTPERDLWKPVRFKYDNTLDTVARIFPDTGLILHGPRYNELSRPMQIFIDEHEKAHMFYDKTEEYCDLFALVSFIRMGYNESTAYYVLSNVLRRSAQQMDRVKFILSEIQQNINPNFNPGI